jgi:hypothetical protein
VPRRAEAAHALGVSRRRSRARRRGPRAGGHVRKPFGGVPAPAPGRAAVLGRGSTRACSRVRRANPSCSAAWPSTSPSGGRSSSSCSKRRRWRPSANSRPGSPTTSTTCSPRSSATATCSSTRRRTMPLEEVHREDERRERKEHAQRAMAGCGRRHPGHRLRYSSSGITIPRPAAPCTARGA